MQIRTWLSKAKACLSNSDNPKLDAEVLLGKVIGKSRAWLIAFDDIELNSQELNTVNTFLTRRALGEPIAWIIGEREFWSLPLSISPYTLIPRPDTELVVEKALLLLPNYPCSILDLGTGVGSIALALASERPDCEVTGIDFIPAVLTIAEHNAIKLSIKNIHFLYSDWFSAITNKQYNLIVSNPPYIDANDVHLTKGDVRFEPVSALVAGDQGLAAIKMIASSATNYLIKNGWLLIEHGWNQGKAVRKIFSKNGLKKVVTYQDYNYNDRVTCGIKNYY